MNANETIEIAGQWWSVPQVARALNVSGRTIRNWISAGLLKGARFGGVWRIANADLQAFTQRAHAEAERIRAGNEPSATARKLAELSQTEQEAEA